MTFLPSCAPDELRELIAAADETATSSYAHSYARWDDDREVTNEPTICAGTGNHPDGGCCDECCTEWSRGAHDAGYCAVHYPRVLAWRAIDALPQRTTLD